MEELRQKVGKYGETELACKGLCVRYPVIRKLCKGMTENWYSKGRYCRTCSSYVAFNGIDGNKCKCCNRQVRRNPHLTADKKAKYQNIKRIDA